ncbi:MAG TPA: helix-turn-helix domain-containing protein [Thermoplasmata archaeon]|nr:helix-turn-helix domain-containing protein [Thermoplasmata archaeon]
MAKRGLTANEKQVLHGLVRHPILNDRELSELLGVKVSTVTAIRRRLRHADYFVTRRVPMMHRLGWELLIGGFARLDMAQGGPAAARLRDLIKDRFPDLFHIVASSDQMSFLGFAHDYTTARRQVDELRLALDRSKLLGERDVTLSVFPMSLSILPAFFDYSHPLALAFGIEDRILLRMEHAKSGDIELTRKETEVLKGLVRFPELSDKALAQRVKVSRQAVSKMRREFEEEGLLRTVRIPNLRLLGFELYITAFARFTPSSSLRTRTDAFERLLRSSPTFFLVSDDAEAVVLGTSKSYEEFSVLNAGLTKHFKERGHLAGDPEVSVGLTGATEILRNCEFGPLVQSLMPPEPKSSR